MSNDDETASERRIATVGRRGLLGGMMASATLAAAAGTAFAATGCDDGLAPEDEVGRRQAEALSEAERGLKRIDTHHHALPPKVKQWMVDQGLLPPAGGPPWATWSLSATLELMDSRSIQAGVVSMPAPSDIFLDRNRALTGVRILNESLAELVRAKPRRFGFFAYLPLAHVDIALEELAFAADHLGADGFLLMNHVENKYLGDPVFEPLFAELNRRRAVFMTHPDSLPSEAPGGSETTPEIPNHIGDFMLDTTRGALGMMFSGVLDRYPDISIILPHGGGFIPYIGARMTSARRRGEGFEPEKLRGYLRRFYYDTAAPMSPYATPTQLMAADVSHLLYGTDWHQVAAAVVEENAAAFMADPALSSRARVAIGRDNALRLFPRLAARIRG